MTLIDENGHPLDMGTAFDEMDDLSPLSPGTSQAAQRNRLLLNAIMFGGGFKGISTEWWHFELPDAAGYPLLDDVFACLSPLTLTESFHEYESHLFTGFRPRCWPLRWQRLSPRLMLPCPKICWSSVKPPIRRRSTRPSLLIITTGRSPTRPISDWSNTKPRTGKAQRTSRATRRKLAGL